MRQILLTASLLAFGLATTVALTPSAAHAADAANPYGNVNHANDEGNNTGDSQVGGLNNSQLNKNYKGPLTLRAPAGSEQPTQTAQPTMAPPTTPPPPMPPPGATAR